MRPDPASTLSRVHAGRETGRSAPTDVSGLNMATGVYTGIALGLAVWLWVVAICALIAALT